MWCLRYFFILPLLPYPTSSPLFYALFLISLLSSQRPCIYCSLILSCLFAASYAIQHKPSTAAVQTTISSASKWISQGWLLEKGGVGVRIYL
ncbi:hypothetical protein T439DRAFT_375945 [Meredithblackwellia eburnea MCA 4105]